MEPSGTNTASETPALEFRRVTLSFDERPALDDVSFVLRRGQMICLTGAANSGKSVLLRLAIGLLRPDAGEILVNGEGISQLDETDLLAVRGREMGIVFQDESLFTSLTVYDNVAYRLVEHDWPENEIERAVREILRFVGLENEVNKFYEELSGGMKRRVEIARALVGWPRLMLFDEPTSGLDPINAGQVLDLVIRARDIHHISSLYVTKALDEIPYLATHRALVNEGGVIEVRAADAPFEPETKVMLLEEGKVAFFGSSADFTRSSLPAVRQMTHPQTGVSFEHVSVPDPWSRKRKFKSQVL